MCSIPIQTERPLELKELLFQKYKIEIPITKRLDSFYIRISLNAYNSQEDIEKLRFVLQEIKNRTTIFK